MNQFAVTINDGQHRKNLKKNIQTRNFKESNISLFSKQQQHFRLSRKDERRKNFSLGKN